MLLLTVVFAVTAWLLAEKFVFKSKVPSVLGYSALIVDSGSMSGKIEEGDLIVIRKTGDYAPDDIITFIKDGDTAPTTHRIIRLGEGGGFVTMGDANNGPDSLEVYYNEILGEVVQIYGGVGSILGWLGEEGYTYILGAIAIVFAALILLRRPDTAGTPDGSDKD